MARYRKKPVVVDASQYGTDSNAVYLLAEFILERPPEEISDSQICDVLLPTGLWDPPDNAGLKLWVIKSNEWCDLEVGDWVIKESDGVGVYPCKKDIFSATYEAVTDEGEM